VEAGNATAKVGTLGATVEPILADLKRGAAYFFADDGGNRLVFDLKDPSQTAAIAEPGFPVSLQNSPRQQPRSHKT
jgi:hypothetical protein